MRKLAMDSCLGAGRRNLRDRRIRGMRSMPDAGLAVESARSHAQPQCAGNILRRSAPLLDTHKKMPQLENIEAIERRLWGAADTLRANSNYASNEYFMPVMGLIFLRHAYSRYLAVKDAIAAGLPTRGGKTRPLTKEDFSQKNAILLRPEAQFDALVALPDAADRAAALIAAMESIEHDYESLRGVLPKTEYQELDNAVLGQLLRTLNPEEL